VNSHPKRLPSWGQRRGLHRGPGSGGRGFGERLREPPTSAVSGGSGGPRLTRTRANLAFGFYQSTSWSMSCLPASAIEPESDG
jgi:hypothetical protein